MKLNGRIVGLIVLALLITAGSLLVRTREQLKNAESALPPNTMVAPDSTGTSGLRVLATLPPFELETETGSSLGLDELHGQIWVADFIFTRCAGTCPVITHEMGELQKDLGANPADAAVKLVSISVDPDFDTPDVLTKYAKLSNANPARWTFLTGTRDAVRSLVVNGFKLPVGEGASKEEPLIHSQNLVLVDRAGRVRGIYDGLSDAGRTDLKAALAKLLPEAAPTDVFVPADVANKSWVNAQKAAQLASAASITAEHDFKFTDQIGASGITFKHTSSADVGKLYRAIHYDHGTAVAVADVDGDGLPDLFFVNQIGKSALFKNLGGGRFQDITESSGLSIGGGRACVAASFADIDNDGDPDLFVTCIRDGNLLFENDGHGHFTDITAKAGVAGTHGHSSGAVFFDYDGDGLLDLFVTNVGQYTFDKKREGSPYEGELDAFAGHLHPERSERSILYKNLGGNKFEDVTESSGLKHTAWSGEATAFDYDGDGHIDLYVASMQGHDELWRNLGNGKFELTGRRVFPATPWGAMGVKVLDWNGDGKLDLYVTDMHTDMAGTLEPGTEKKKHDPATMFPFNFLGTDGHHVLGNALFTNLGGGKFDEQSDAANVENGWPWGPSAGDLNADGYPDLFIAAGMNYPFRYSGNSVLLNEGGKRFADAEYVLGVEPRAHLAQPWFQIDCDNPLELQQDICRGEAGPVMIGDPERPKTQPRHGVVTVWASRASRSAVIFDLDGDGDLDVVTCDYNDYPQVFISDLAQRHTVHALTVKLIGKKSNRDGLGALVTVQADGHAQLQLNDGKSGYLAQSSMPLYFGLGEAEHADSIQVKWPTGKTQTVRGPLKSGAPVVIVEE